ncbi:MAG TPA: hypothetical protein ENK57_21105 [Polyangiaceae bacterium]|nr:hypothetical protein [Polyangiaceae bacterium]
MRTSSIAAVILATATGLAGCEEDDASAPAGAHTSSARAAPTPTKEPPEPPPPLAEREDLPNPDHVAKTLHDQREAMIARMIAMEVLHEDDEPALRAIFERSRILGQGNPAAVDHPMTRRECLDRRRAAGVRDEPKPLCGAPFMTPIYDPAVQEKEDAKVCIDRYEFPNLPCDYPVTWVTAKEAIEICGVLGKRLCDAHEWEGACAGKVLPPERDYDWRGPRDSQSARHNADREILWAYGQKKQHDKCATTSHRSKRCATSSWGGCGSNTFPAGAFPECRSAFGVYDQHGNAAEHMLLPLKESDLGAKGGTGVAEMKGSWFIFDHYEAHKDDCRWRAPSWHDDEGLRHANYHLGFRCCKDVGR